MTGADAPDPTVGPQLWPQPNVPGRGIVASYGTRFWGLVIAIGVGAGLTGVALMKLLAAVERLAWSATSTTTLVQAAERTAPLSHLLVVTLAGLLAGGAGLLIGRLRADRGTETTEALWLHDARIPLPASLARGVVSIITVGMGSSLGREGAPQLASAALASTLAQWAAVPAWQRRLLVACGAGAGMAAVYNVPLGGALFAIEVLLGTVTLPLVLPALATTLIATTVAWIALPNGPIYHLPSFTLTASQLVWAALAGPIAGLTAVLWARAIAHAHRLRPKGPSRVIAPILVFATLAVASIRYPELLGNGIDIVQRSLLGHLALGLLAVLLILKPLATLGCLGSGAPGGLFTPTMALGALLGGLLGHFWSDLWPGATPGSYALIGAAAVLAAAMQAPLSAVVLVVELTHAPEQLMVPMLLSITGATIIARLLRAPSIYSARLPRDAALLDRHEVPTGHESEPEVSSRSSDEARSNRGAAADGLYG